MEIDAATRLFSALGHTGRLLVFRLLMRHAPHGVRPTEIAEALGLKQNTLSHYLAELEAAGLVRSERHGRSIHYAADIETAAALIAYLFADCGRSRPELSSPFLAQPEPIMPQKTYNVLFICSGNSARSIFAEALMRDLGEGRFNAYSAGTRPNSELNPFALDVLARNDHHVEGLRSKHLLEFQKDGAPKMDFVFTVCDTSAAEECPPWPGQPISGHWGLPDPVKVTGTAAEKSLAFAQTYAGLRRRITAFAALPIEQLDRIALQKQVDRIGLDQD
ncbi:transcriptional regulator, ArsR family [Gemmobacter aquatilis]|uniref:Transcriptional regulator, ArsR family n=1 Tax=Gemmobacter aquatilis TaxID=933059 RepID=A0A1H7Z5K8_9RHOB|nr:metalloregulator ArsR/SmtB family transcription factor [Gemmobacter aquatilis]SEM53274.1 transcriptional regulator, ArsR family [Gemmobacter aquatilis]